MIVTLARIVLAEPGILLVDHTGHSIIGSAHAPAAEYSKRTAQRGQTGLNCLRVGSPEFVNIALQSLLEKCTLHETPAPSPPTPTTGARA